MKIFSLLFLLFITVTSGNSQKLFTGVWRSGSSGTYLWSGVEWNDFNSKIKSLEGNMRLIDIETYTVGSKRYYSGVWEQGKDKYDVTPPGLDWTAFSRYWATKSKTLRLIDIETYVQDGKRCFLGIFREGADGHRLTPLNLDWKAFEDFWIESSKTLRLIDIETYTEKGKRYFLGVYRQGSGGHVLSPYGKDWEAFKTYWDDLAKQNLRLIDIESFEENGKRLFLGVWRQGSDSYSLLHGIDFESMSSAYAQSNPQNLRLVDLETYDIDCSFECLNQALLPDNPATADRESYNYNIPASALHCEGDPDSCPSPTTANDVVSYRWPNVMVGNDAYLRTNFLYQHKPQIFRLPFKEAANDMNPLLGWLYKKGDWHHAIDYSKKDLKTFEIVAAAKGRVIYKGWDRWSGNTLIMSHDVGRNKDAYRTIYMHLMNGPETDCNISWSQKITWGSTSDQQSKKAAYETRLKNNGCPEKIEDRNPTEAYWGKDDYKIATNIVGKTFEAGERLGYAGRTGPGGQNAIHLHIFFAQRDATTSEWYLFDPFGTYAYGSCYPDKVDGSPVGSCARYPVAWKNGKPGY